MSEHRNDEEEREVYIVWEGNIVCCFVPNGDGSPFIRFTVKNENGVKVYIRPKEGNHNIPHFHFCYGGNSASYEIASGERLTEERGIRKIDKKVKEYWKQKHEQYVLANVWNKTRPGDIKKICAEVPNIGVSDKKDADERIVKILKQR